jgi:6-phosphogluconate dehydrogenase
MGVSGVGKTTIGTALALDMDAKYLDGDAFHSIQNREKMANGYSLDDNDRWPWLQSLCDAINFEEKSVVASCSALKNIYREFIWQRIGPFKLIYLHGDKNIIYERMTKRENHFMPTSLLQSQMDMLEEPQSAIKIDVNKSMELIIKEIKIKMEAINEIGVLGLGVMGKSLARNISNNGFPVTVYNLPFVGEETVVNDFIEEHGNENLVGAADLTDFIKSLKAPRLILLMITAGKAIDDTIELLLPLVEKGDMIIDAGNTFYEDTERRYEYLKAKGLHFIGMGVSGGEKGALIGPSIMPAGDIHAQERLMPILNKISAIADNIPCVNWFGHGGAGHFIKMIHNGIEYADMQIISEGYFILKHGYSFSNEEIASHFQTLKGTLHSSYLIDITIEILLKKENDQFLLDDILDVAGHKGTGVWTSISALKLGVAAPTIIAAMNQRILSSEKKLRMLSIEKQQGNKIELDINTFNSAILFARLTAIAEGMHILKAASKKYYWDYKLADVVQAWRGGCIIRSEMLTLFLDVFIDGENFDHVMETQKFRTYMSGLFISAKSLNKSLSDTTLATPAFSAALQYYNTLMTDYLPINLIQAQRDYFGAHTYEKLSNVGEKVHTKW